MFFSLDPAKGKGAEIERVDATDAWGLSHDASEIAIVDSGESGAKYGF